MQPQQQPYQQPQQPQSLDFTQQSPQPAPVQQQPLQPQAPQFDPDQFKREIVDELKNAITPQQPIPADDAGNQQQQKKYDDWDTVFADVDARVEHKFQEQQKQQETFNQQLTEQEKQNQRIIDDSLNSLRTAGYLPNVADPFNQTDPGKQAEFELIGYAVSLGTTDLVKAAQELKFRHDAGYKYDYNSRQFVQTMQPQGDSFFGDPNQNGVQPQYQQPQPMQPQVSYPVGPQNPYMGGQQQPQYPAGFNAPVSNGSSYMGVQGMIPPTKVLRNSSYDDLVNQFNRTQ